MNLPLYIQKESANCLTTFLNNSHWLLLLTNLANYQLITSRQLYTLLTAQRSVIKITFKTTGWLPESIIKL